LVPGIYLILEDLGNLSKRLGVIGGKRLM
jgi:hypothetical protein